MNSYPTILNQKLYDLFKNRDIQKNIINSLYYFGGTFIAFIISIFTQPIFSRYLELKDFATIGYFTAIQAVLYPLFSMSLPFYYLAKYWEMNSESSPQRNLSFILNFLNISNCVIAIISYFIVNAYFEILKVKIPLHPFIYIVLINLFFEKYKTYYLIECRVAKKGLNFFLLNLFQVLLNTCFSLYFVIILKGGATGRMGGVLLGVICTSLISFFILIREKKYSFSFKIDWTKLKAAIKYSYPLIIGSYAYYPIGNIDRIFLERLGNTNEYGYYSIALTISGFIGTFFVAFYQSFEPDLYRLVSQKRYKQYIIYTTIYTSFFAGVTFLFIILSDTLVSLLTSNRYTHASYYSNILVFSILIMQIGGIFEQLFTAFGKTKLVMWRNTLMGTICIIAYYYLIKHYQFEGAMIARVITAIIFLVIGAIMFLITFTKRKSRAQHETDIQENF